MSGVNPTFPGGDPNKPWDKQPWDKSSPANENGGSDGGVVEEVVGSVVESVAEVAAHGCLEGCAGCSLAVLVPLFATAGTAMAAGLLR